MGILAPKRNLLIFKGIGKRYWEKKLKRPLRYNPLKPKHLARAGAASCKSLKINTLGKPTQLNVRSGREAPCPQRVDFVKPFRW